VTMMWNPRLFLTTRGNVLLLLKKQGACTVAHLSQQLKLTPNAIRQHLSAMERDNLVTHQSVKTGPSKPALVFSLTSQAESLFPKQYESLLLDLLQELLKKEGSASVRHMLSQLGHRAAEKHRGRLVHLAFEEKIEEVGRIMEEGGSITEWEHLEEGLVMRDFNCPYAVLARAHPEACEVQRSFLQQLLEPARVDIACLRQETRCQFQINTNANSG
jgi:predicted ArsR family transcriptional regulator